VLSAMNEESLSFSSILCRSLECTLEPVFCCCSAQCIGFEIFRAEKCQADKEGETAEEEDFNMIIADANYP
jgi:hypothetical protein